MKILATVKLCFILSVAVVKANNIDDATFGSFYPTAKAIQTNYSCCIYKGESESDRTCQDADFECIADYRKQMDTYYIASFIIFAVAIMVLVLWCVKRHRADLSKHKVKKDVYLQEMPKDSNDAE